LVSPTIDAVHHLNLPHIGKGTSSKVVTLTGAELLAPTKLSTKHFTHMSSSTEANSDH